MDVVDEAMDVSCFRCWLGRAMPRCHGIGSGVAQHRMLDCASSIRLTITKDQTKETEDQTLGSLILHAISGPKRSNEPSLQTKPLTSSYNVTKI
jgi:hypothetical protein